ncbi:MAG TPA: hypothetical protein HPP66_07435 [Planctomycetes bacterium]|nr:hypothetical protein [Planctomycetota bacterium]
MIVEMNKKISSDYIVGNIAALSMCISLLFLIFQVLVWIPVAIVAIVLVENNIIPKPQGGLATLMTFVLAESILIAGIIIHIKRKYMPFELTDCREQGQLKPFNERYLEWMLNITAGAGILWIILLGLSFDSIRIFLIVIQGFGILFLTIFFIVRLLLTKRFAFRTLFSVLLSAAAIWIAIMA